MTHISHFQKQSLARYGVNLSNSDVDQIIENIQHSNEKEYWGKAFFVHRESKAITHYIVVQNGVGMRVVYSNKKGILITALPPQGKPKKAVVKKIKQTWFSKLKGIFR